MFQMTEFQGHERVMFAHDALSGLRAIIAIHSTVRGPSLGGCRVWAYDSDEAALRDALRLSKAMTYKAAMADLPLGGGKSVVLVERRGAKTPEMFDALGKAIDELDGLYIAAEDVGSTPADMARVRRFTPHVTGLSPADGGVGDPSPTTADGCFIGVKATAARIGRPLDGLHVAIQGLGHVGYGLAERLAATGARLTVADLDENAVRRAVERLGATGVSADEIARVPADIFSPNALGGVLNARSIPELQVAAVSGGANNQLATAEDGDALAARCIVYAPDYVMNAGGVIKMCAEYFGWEDTMVDLRVAGIATRLDAIFAEAERTGRSTNRIADEMAEALVSPPALSEAS
ncbi:MAG: Glu/Leu/Phe/Val dehydrogenase dimerization domain-containing protein [Pseudomonadota bacterium]